MSTLIRWEPLKELEDLQNRLTSLFGRMPLRRTEGKEDIALGEWAPLADITEDDKEYLIKLELPEVKKEDVKVTVENGVLTISGERKFEKEEKDKKYHRVERAYGSFLRSFTLPDDADPDNVKAEFKDGMLTVHLSKNKRAKPKTEALPFHGLARPAPLRLILPELHSPPNGRINAKEIAKFLGVPLAKLCAGLKLNYSTVHKVPDSDTIQPALMHVKRSLEILYEVFRTPEAIRAWMNASHPDLGMTPLDAILSDKAEALETMLENALAGIPS